MDLDTKLKSTNKQKALKIVPAILAFITCCLIVIQCLPILQTARVFRDNTFEVNKTVMDMSSFQSYLEGDYQDIVYNTVKDDVSLKIEKERESFVSKAFDDFKKAQEYYLENKDEINTKIENYDYGNGEIISYEYSLKYEDYDGGVFFDNEYDSPYSDINLQIQILTDLDTVKTQIQEEFNEHVRWDQDYNVVNVDPFSSKTIKFYAKSKSGKLYTNVADEKALKQSINYDNGFTYENKKFSESKLLVEYVCESPYYYSYLDKVYILLEPSYENDDKYTNCLEIFDLTEKDITSHIYAIAVLLVILLALFIWSLIMAGAVEDGFLLKKVDKMPNDLHFILSLAIATGFAGLCCLCVYGNLELWFDYARQQLFESQALRRLTTVGACLSAGAVYFVVLALFQSIARQLKLKSGYWKNTLIAKFVKSCIINPIKNYKKLKSFEPKVFTKRLILVCALYIVINICAIVAIGCGIVSRFLIVSLMGTIVLFGMNIASAVFVIKYIVNLDKIIFANQTRTAPMVDYNKLPKSLKLLVDSQRLTQQELETAVNKAVSDERMRVELITNVSHDLKTPLTSIISYVDLLKGCDIENEDAKEYIGILEEKGGRLKRLIDDLIEASKITSGVVTLNPTQLNLSELATQAVVEHQQEFVDNDLELVFKGDKSSVMTFADGAKTYRVIENLLSNARKYSAKGSRVYADVYEQNNTSIFEIKNMSAQPLDITPEELKERFVRGDKSRNLDGNGLGLSIADNLCQAMKGRMEIVIDGDLFKVKVVLPKIKIE